MDLADYIDVRPQDRTRKWLQQGKYEAAWLRNPVCLVFARRLIPFLGESSIRPSRLFVLFFYPATGSQIEHDVRLAMCPYSGVALHSLEKARGLGLSAKPPLSLYDLRRFSCPVLGAHITFL